jgi:hypothetical protein
MARGVSGGGLETVNGERSYGAVSKTAGYIGFFLA